MEEFFKLISNYGFPIVISGYLLFRMESKIEGLRKDINGREGIIDKIEDITKTIKDCCDKK